MLLACASPIKCNVVQESTCDIWYLDSSCNNHMTDNLNLFSSLDNSIQTDVTLGKNVQVNVLGKGTVGIITKHGDSKFIPNVYHVEDLKHNLLSIGQLIQKGYRVCIEHYHYLIKDKHPSNQLIAKVSMTSNRLFPLRIILDMKGKTNTRVAFKEESKEAVEHFDKKENDTADFQAALQIEV